MNCPRVEKLACCALVGFTLIGATAFAQRSGAPQQPRIEALRAQAVSIAQLRGEADLRMGQRVVVEGILRARGDNYYVDPRFALVDSEGNELPVSPWAPLEIPPSPPGAATPPAGIQIMADYLDRPVVVEGVYRLDARRGGDLLVAEVGLAFGAAKPEQ